MAISRVTGQQTGETTFESTTIYVAYPGNVTAGNLLIIGVASWTGGTGRAPIAGDFSKSGTCTLGTVACDVSDSYEYTMNSWECTAIYSVPVTGTGSCTVTISNLPTGSWSVIGIEEVSGADVSASRLDGTPLVVHQTTTTAPDTGTIASTDGALFFGVLNLGDASAVITIMPDGAFTQIYEQEDAANFGSGSIIDRIVTTSTTDSASWTLGTAKTVISLLAVYKAAAGATLALNISTWDSACFNRIT